MDLPVTLPINQGVTKKLFKLKPLRYDGLLLNIHHSTGSKKVRFVHICFHNTDPLIVSADNEGHFYIIDYSACKFWALPILDSCTFIKFSPLVQNELLIGRSNGDILLVNIDSGHVVGKLQGHELGVEYVSFAKHKYCLSKSQEEGIVWDLETNSKIQVLNLEKNNLLKFHEDVHRNGQFMIIAGYLPTLAVFDLGSWKLTKMVTLPDYIHTLKHIGFVSQPFDGGSNKILIILSGQGIIYFYDVEQNVILSELSSKTEINKFACSADGTHLSCLLCSGEMKLYCIKQYVASPVEVKVQDIEKKMKSRRTRPLGDIVIVKQEVVNWCQHWFEYFPLPPVNILAMIENILLEHDPELLHHYASNNITSNIYVWPLLETAFSEVLTSSEWLHLWDHVLTNEISFLLCAAAAYNITQRHTLVALKKLEDFEFFFHNQNPNDMKKLLKTTYCLLNNTCQRLHPRQYMEKFRGLEKGNYPLFIEYPKTIIDFRSEKFKEIEGGLKSLADDETALLQKAREEDLEKVKAELRKEEKRREKEVEKKCFEQLKSKIDFLKYKQQDLARKKAELHWKETHSSSAPVKSLTNDSNEEFANGRLDEQEHSVKKHVELSKSKEKYLKQLKELLKYKYVIDKGFDQNASLSDNDTNIMKKKYQQQINTEIEKIRKSLGSLEDLKKLNITTSLEVIDKFIDSIEREIKPKESRSGKADVQSEVLKLLRFMKRNKSEFADESQNCSAGNKALTCFCETVCPKTVRFSISESSGS
nr:TBC1 domain family member 31 [Leptinotarsa decemlineata]